MSASNQTRDLYFPAMESFRASLWLLAVKEIAQSLVAAHQAIELGLKALLESVHPTLVLARVARDEAEYECLKYLCAGDFAQSPFGNAVKIPNRQSLNNGRFGRVTHEFRKTANPTSDKTIWFDDAYERVRELLPTQLDSQLWKDLKTLHTQRNDIMHRGGKPSASLDEGYLGTLLEIAYPFFEHYSRVVTGDNTMEWSFNNARQSRREVLTVARHSFRRFSPKMDRLEAIRTFEHAWWWYRHNEFGPTRYLTCDRDQADPAYRSHVDQSEQRGKRFRERWTDGFVLHGSNYTNLRCRICDKDNYLVACERRVIETGVQAYLRACAVYCVFCELNLSDHDRRMDANVAAILADEHVGPITANELGKVGWNQVTQTLRNGDESS